MVSIDPSQYLPIAIPLLILQYGLALFGLYDLVQEDRRARGGSKALWALVIHAGFARGASAGAGRRRRPGSVVGPVAATVAMVLGFAAVSWLAFRRQEL